MQSSLEHGSCIFDFFAKVLLVSCSNYWSIFVHEPCVIMSLFKMCCWHDIYLVGLEHFLFSHILGIIIPTDFHIFQKGWNHQPVSLYTPMFFVFNITGRPHQSDDAMFTIFRRRTRHAQKQNTCTYPEINQIYKQLKPLAILMINGFYQHFSPLNTQHIPTHTICKVLLEHSTLITNGGMWV